MAEDPIKLFATRAERYPRPNEIDATRTALEKAAELVPVFGPATVQVIAQFLVPGVERRREEWFKELADDFDHLNEKVDGFSVQDLAQNEPFISATIQATRIAIGIRTRFVSKWIPVPRSHSSSTKLLESVCAIALGPRPLTDLRRRHRAKSSSW